MRKTKARQRVNANDVEAVQDHLNDPLTRADKSVGRNLNSELLTLSQGLGDEGANAFSILGDLRGQTEAGDLAIGKIEAWLGGLQRDTDLTYDHASVEQSQQSYDKYKRHAYSKAKRNGTLAKGQKAMPKWMRKRMVKSSKKRTNRLHEKGEEMIATGTRASSEVEGQVTTGEHGDAYHEAVAALARLTETDLSADAGSDDGAKLKLLLRAVGRDVVRDKG